MDLVELLPSLYFLRFPVGHVYLWRDRDGLTLIDSGVPGSAPLIADAVRSLGHTPSDVRRLVLTHFHEDHTGSAADIALWGDVTVYAHRDDAPFVRGEAAGPPPVLSGWEQELWDAVHVGMPHVPAPPVRVDRELGDGDTLDFGGGAQVLAVPGHTPGSLAVHLPGPGVLFTGDTVARAPDGQVILGVFNADPAGAVASLARQAALDVEIACFGHGEPVTEGARGLIRDAAARFAG
ncbi:MBL fold metallo-hydrolase [Microbispora bryophytorum]|uniref:Putative metallo-beta-lactamase superfamily protein n=1 Tax=Microbispora bryophytorum TaxID=1460882 RepID=A0A8H9LG03_9ACTN|nr:MBL fold metallo-hydrolase [Microbispora bryophytorum]MBD3139089.1 MBL fold metallo-hydrolase [Microbispora bryophytorum]TQS03159.1 MBL fold metallo-hydrolase [Microbispora bryophytorum]GGO09363.1 putative metallo-beta-lactamase superfamily protein [Microbispora bryophytorum]